jgi:hypothetical protein
MKKTLAVLIALCFMSGCVVVSDGHCPPGQAKKGRCI